MTVEAEVCNGAVHEVDGIEEEREFGAGSFQDPAKPELEGIVNHDQADDPEDSYVLVTDVGNPSADGEDMAAVDGSPTHESSAPGELLGIELDARNGNPEGGNVCKHGNAEAGDAAADGSPREEPSAPGEHLGIELEAPNRNPEGASAGEHTSVNGSPDVQVISIVDGGGNQDNAVEECSEELNYQNGKIDAVNGEVDPTLREGGSGNVGSTNKNPSVADGGIVGVEGSVWDVYEIQDKLAVSEPECEAESEIKKDVDSNGNIDKSEEAELANKPTVSEPECEAESEIKKAEDSSGKIGRLEEAEFENKLATSKLESEAESEIKKAEYSDEKIERSEEAEVANNLAVSKPECEAESNIEKAEDSNGKIERSEEAEVANKLAISIPECEAESEIEKAEDSTGKIERSEEAEVVNKLVGSKPECEAESETKKDEDSNGKIERSDESEVARFEEQNGKLGVVAVPEPDSVEENQESKVLNLGWVADSGEEDEPKNLLSPSDKQETVEDEVESVLSKEAMQDQKCDIDPENDDQYELDEDKVVEGTADCNVETVCGEVLEGKDEAIFSSNQPVSAVKLEAEADNSSDVYHVAVTSEKDASNVLEVLDTFVSGEGVSNSMLESADVKVVVGGATRSDDQTLLLAKNGDTGNSCSLDKSKVSPESSSDTITKEDVSGIAVTKPFNFFVRLPRYSDEKLQEQIRIAELEVKDKTKLRDSIQAQIQEIRAKNQNNGIDYEYAKGEDRNLKKLLKEKRMEIDSLQSVINKAKNATSIEDLNSRIKTIEHMIQHETLPLKEEKQLINEIKQLKQLREQLSSNKCSQNEIQQALEQRELAEERLKILRKELGNLKVTASKAQTACDEAESKYNDEYRKVKELQAQFRVADDVRQESYAKFLSLSKELSQKRKNFFKVKNDSAAATYHAFTDDRKTLYRHCVNEVDNFMDLWNGNEEFRSEYVRLNTRSTLRRFGTLDGRSLGSDEKPTILPSYVGERNDKVVSVPANADSISKTPTLELMPETKIENVSLDIHSSKKETESKVKTVTTGGHAKSEQVNSLVTDSGMDEEKVEVQKEPVKTKEELELIRKGEEIRREEAEAKLKEQRRLEEIVKSKEARERKQRRDEKAQKREELKAMKEAEQKEKEREKKSRKKERRKAASSTSTPMDVQDDASSITCVEINKEEASTQVSDVSTKKTKTNRVMVSKQNKTRSTPPPSLRNRNRRKWQQWMSIILISLAVLVLFWLGNLGVFSSVHSRFQGTGY